MTASLTSDPLTLRAACIHDLPAIEALIARSARELSVGFYTETQVASLLRHVFGADTQQRFTLALPDGIEVPVAGMSRPIDLPTPAGAEA